MNHADAIKTLMIDFLKDNKTPDLRIKEYDHNVRLSNQKAVQTDPDGKRKFDTGLETINLYIEHPGGRREPLAKLREQEDGTTEFEDISLDSHVDILPLATQ